MMSPFISRNTDTITISSNTSSILLNSLSSVDQQNRETHNHFLAKDQRRLQDALCSVAQTPASVVDIHKIANNATIGGLNYPQQLALHRVIAKQEEVHSKLDSCSIKFLNSVVSTAQNGNTDHIFNSVNGAIANDHMPNTNESNKVPLSEFCTSTSLLTNAMDDRSKKSQNMTECVPVPSSEHVAEIVGRQGCKIKALRAKTNTYIKTPVRGEEPVFVVTGRKEDVTKAKREILSAAEHFSLIRATRKPSGGSAVGKNDNNEKSLVNNDFAKVPLRSSTMPGHVTIQVRVPYRVVGLVVGPKGTTIKHIQHQTQTYIVTPSREKEPIFEVTGLPNNVQSARKQIEAHIASRTGRVSTPGGNSNSLVALADSSNEVPAVQNLHVLSKILNDPTEDSDILLALCEDNSIRSTPGYECGTCEVPTKKSYVNDLEYSNGYGKNDFNIRQEFIENGISFLHPDSFQLQYLNTSNQTLDYMSDLAENIDLETNSESAYFLADLNPTHKFQKKKEFLFPSFQPTLTLNHNLHTSSLSSMKQTRLFRTDSNVSSYMQINFANNDAFDYKPISGTAGPSDLQIHFANNDTSDYKPGTAGSSDIQNCGITPQHNNNRNLKPRSYSSASSTASSRSANNSGSWSSSRKEVTNIWKNFGESLDLDEGFSDLPNLWTLPTPLSTLKSSNSSPSTSISPTDSFSAEIATHTPKPKEDGLNSSVNQTHHGCKINKSLIQKKHFGNEGVMPTLLMDTMTPRLECLVCNNKKVNAILVPCGHTMLCIECAHRICELDNGICPICSLNVYHATRVII